MNNHPIGIFDSGIGGLTVANAVKNCLPNEEIIYFGDTAHLPYGEKSSDAIKSYTLRIIEFLIQKKCKAVVIACNTASATAYEVAQKKLGNQIEIINVIDPVVEYVSKNYHHKKIGVIGTKRTIASRIYVKKLKKLNPANEVVSMATPLLAQMIEEGFYNNFISKTIINNYLSKKSFINIDAIILGCTHYPLIKNEVSEYFNHNVDVIDSAEIVAQHLKQYLTDKKLLSNNKTPHHHFIVSDYTESFAKSTKHFFKERIKLEQFHIWNE
ncbi:MAG: glutamate racemase [Vicingaceae bacterium]